MFLFSSINEGWEKGQIPLDVSPKEDGKCYSKSLLVFGNLSIFIFRERKAVGKDLMVNGF